MEPQIAARKPERIEKSIACYNRLNFRPVLLKGYSAAYNSARDYKTAKTPVHNGFMQGTYIPPASSDIQAWYAAAGWVGWIVPNGFHVIDTEDAGIIAAVEDLCRNLKICVPVNNTNRGKQFVFSNDEQLGGDSEQFVKAGFPVTYRSAGKNYVILPPINGRTWTNYGNLSAPPKLPDSLLPYDMNNPLEIASCLSFCVGEALQAGSLSGCDDIDMSFMVFLIENDFTIDQIEELFQIVFRSEFDSVRTISMHQRATDKIKNGEVLRGTGSFVQKVQEAGLKKVERFIGELRRLKRPLVTSHEKKEVTPEPWTDPIPFDDTFLLPDFPIDVLPDVGRRIVTELSEIAQVDSGLPGIMYLSVLSTCRAGDTVELLSHKEPCNLYLAVILPSGQRKTRVVSVLSRPIFDYQLRIQTESADRIREATNRFKILEARLSRLQKQAAGTDDTIQRRALISEANQISAEMLLHPVPTPPVFLCDDITTEKLGMLMSENGERMAIISAEGGIFKLMAGMYNDRDGNFDLYLKAHAGDPWSSHRIGRESLSMRNPSLTMGLAIQPDVLDEIGRNRHFRGRGLVARFLFSIGRNFVGYRVRQTKPMTPLLLNEYRDHIFALLDVPSGCEFGLSPEAHAVWNEFYDDIERDMRPDGALEHMQDWGSKLPGAVARIAGLLHMATNGSEGVGSPISVNIVTASCVIGGYFREHALAAFRQMREDPRIPVAKKITACISRIKLSQFKGRDILRHTYFSARTMEEIQPGIKLMLERGYLREAGGEYAGRGRPEAVAYEVNPRLFEKSISGKTGDKSDE